MAVKWTEASSEVIERAQRIIKKYHPNFLRGELSIGFVFRSEASFGAGKWVLAKVAKVPAKLSPFLDYDVIVWIAENEYAKLSSEQRDALIDHELCHIFYDPDHGAFSIVGHDVEEFLVIIERYGAWNPSLMKMVTKTSQLELPIPEHGQDTDRQVAKSFSGEALNMMDGVEVSV